MGRVGGGGFKTEGRADAKALRWDMPGVLEECRGGWCGWSRVRGGGDGEAVRSLADRGRGLRCRERKRLREGD